MFERPNKVPYCAEEMLDVLEWWKSYTYSNNCKLASKNPEFDFNKNYAKLKSAEDKVLKLNKKINDLERISYKIKLEINKEKNNYKISLLEKITNEENTIYKRKEIKNNILMNNDKTKNIILSINKLNEEINNILEKNKEKIINLHNKVKIVKEKYRIAYLWYKFKIALLSLIFSWLVFSFLYKIYVKLKSNNSPYTIIFSVATFAYWLILLEVFFWFVYDLIPHRFLL